MLGQVGAQLPNLPPASAGAQLLALLSGQPVEARITATLPQGLAQVQIGGETIRLALPADLPPGTRIGLVLEGQGEAGRLAVTVLPDPGKATVPRVEATLIDLGQGRAPAAEQGATVRVPYASALPGQPAAEAPAPLRLAVPVPRQPLPQALMTGRPVEAQVLSSPQPGITRISLGKAALDLALPLPLPPGTALRLQVLSTPAGPLVQVTIDAPLPEPAASAAAARAPQPTIALPPGAPSLAHVLAQATQAALPIQQSLGKLLAALGDAAPALAALPPPVAKAARQLMALPIDLDDAPPTGPALRAAMQRSGLFHEAVAAQGRAATGDAKTLLLGLREQLAAWLGPAIGRVEPVGRRPAPPQRGGVPRALPAEPGLPPADAGPERLGRALAEHAEGALARLRLSQFASLPDARPDAPPAHGREWTMDLPLMLNQQVHIAQLQIAEDGRAGAQDQERAWHLRFAVAFKVIGEVGAHVLLRGRRASVSLWADQADTAAVLAEMLPELEAGFAAAGLEPGMVQVREGAPRPAPPGAGNLVDARS